MARYRAFFLLAIGALLVAIGLFGDSADWATAVQIVAGLILIIDGGVSLGRAEPAKR